MRALDDIWKVYSTISSWLGNQDSLITSREVEDWDRIQLINDYAYFVLFFSQLETYINDEYEELVGRLDESKFMHRVNVLYDRDSAKTTLIGDYYEIRCEIAHGKMEYGNFIHVPRLVEDIQKIITEEAIEEGGTWFAP